MLYLPMNGFRKHIPCVVGKEAHKGIKKPLPKEDIPSLVSSLYIATNQDELLKGLEMIFAKVKEEKAKGKIDVMTMADIVSINIPNK